MKVANHLTVGSHGTYLDPLQNDQVNKRHTCHNKFPLSTNFHFLAQVSGFPCSSSQAPHHPGTIDGAPHTTITRQIHAGAFLCMVYYCRHVYMYTSYMNICNCHTMQCMYIYIYVNPPALPACLVEWGLMMDCLSVLSFCF